MYKTVCIHRKFSLPLILHDFVVIVKHVFRHSILTMQGKWEKIGIGKKKFGIGGRVIIIVVNLDIAGMGGRLTFSISARSLSKS